MSTTKSIRKTQKKVAPRNNIVRKLTGNPGATRIVKPSFWIQQQSTRAHLGNLSQAGGIPLNESSPHHRRLGPTPLIFLFGGPHRGKVAAKEKGALTSPPAVRTPNRPPRKTPAEGAPQRGRQCGEGKNPRGKKVSPKGPMEGWTTALKAAWVPTQRICADGDSQKPALRGRPNHPPQCEGNTPGIWECPPQGVTGPKNSGPTS
ncbi:hypothetical protein JTB14_038296 [Gonioctena quinquepunctata]|nr:hypothetical protein JTB14_038296 [Gonioctena quinquepunctata]